MGDPTPPEPWRELGSGTLNDPKIKWTTAAPNKRAGRTVGCEAVAKEAALALGFTHIWIRHCNHSTTNTFDKVANRRVLRQADEHITVYFGHASHWATHEADVYLIVDARGVPRRMMHEDERQLPWNGRSNPEISRITHWPPRR